MCIAKDVCFGDNGAQETKPVLFFVGVRHIRSSCAAGRDCGCMVVSISRCEVIRHAWNYADSSLWSGLLRSLCCFSSSRRVISVTSSISFCKVFPKCGQTYNSCQCSLSLLAVFNFRSFADNPHRSTQGALLVFPHGTTVLWLKCPLELPQFLKDGVFVLHK